MRKFPPLYISNVPKLMLQMAVVGLIIKVNKFVHTQMLRETYSSIGVLDKTVCTTVAVK